MVEETLCQLGELVLVVVSEKRIRLLEGDQLLENLLNRCVNLSRCELCCSPVVELILCQLDELVLIAVNEKRIRLLVGDQLLENLLNRCAYVALSSGGGDSLPAQ